MFRLAVLGFLVTVIGSSTLEAGAPIQIQPEDVVTVLPRDAIPAIVQPQFVKGGEPRAQMSKDERVLGLSLNGDHRAYPVLILSVHEIVNDVVGGVPVAVTW